MKAFFISVMYIATFLFWAAALFCLFVMTASGCAAAGSGPDAPMVIQDDGQDLQHDDDVPEILSAEWRQRDDFEAFREPLRITPDAELADDVAASIARYSARLGIEIEIVDDGIPITLEDEIIGNGGKPVDGKATADPTCVFDECNFIAKHHTRIRLARALIAERSFYLAQSVDHELGHVISGWGRALPGPSHLADDAKHLMSPGCRNHVCGPWTVEDASMLCAGAPCTKMDLTAAP